MSAIIGAASLALVVAPVGLGAIAMAPSVRAVVASPAAGGAASASTASASTASAASASDAGRIASPGTTAAGAAAQSADTAERPSNAPTPPMGYNNWAQYMCDIDQQLIEDQAKALVDTGLAKAGYDTVTVDDCWMQQTRDAAGNLQVDTGKFPDGMEKLGEYIHGLGLKYGIYLDAGTYTCGGYAGSYGHIDQDIAQLAAWGADYVKMDGCNMPTVSGESKEDTYRRVYTEVSRAIAKTGRPMTFSNSSPAYFSIPDKLPAWYSVMDWSGDISELWRESWDIDVFHGSTSRWPGIMRNYDYNKPIERFNSPGHWNDPDFIIGGNAGVTETEGRTQLTLWSMMAAPLILSTDTTALSGQYLDDLKNPRMIAIDQDAAGSQGTLISSDGTGEVMYRPLANGDFAVSLLNRSGSTRTVSTTATKLGFPAGGSYAVTDVWSGATSTSDGGFSASLPAHAAAFFRVTPHGAGAAAASGQVMTPDQTVCIDASAALAHPGKAATQASCDASEDQRVVRAPHRALEIADTGDCLTPASDDRGAAVTVAACDGSSIQSWGYTKHGQLINDDAALCLGSGSGTTAAGAALAVNTCGPDPLYQIWSVPGKVTTAVTPLPTAPPSGTFWASDATPVSATVGYGVLGKDVAIKDTASSPDVPLQPYWTDPATGTTPTYDKGWGTHASSTITYDLGGNCTSFSSDVFIQNGFGGDVVFSLVADGTTVYTSDPAHQGVAPQHATADLTGVHTFQLVVDPAPGHNINAAHSDWGDAKFVCDAGDETAPVTTASVAPHTPASGWYRTAPTLTLTAKDAGGVFATQYRVTAAGADAGAGSASTAAAEASAAVVTRAAAKADAATAGAAADGEWHDYSAPVVLPEGDLTVDYRSIDDAGNRETAKSLHVRVDLTAPTASADTDADARTVTLAATDSGSGVDRIDYSLDDGATWSRYDGPIAVAGTATTVVQYRATDVAGNSSPVAHVTLAAVSTPGDGGAGGSGSSGGSGSTGGSGTGGSSGSGSTGAHGSTGADHGDPGASAATRPHASASGGGASPSADASAAGGLAATGVSITDGLIAAALVFAGACALVLAGIRRRRRA